MRRLPILAFVVVASLGGCIVRPPEIDITAVPFTPFVAIHSFVDGDAKEYSFRVTTDADEFAFKVEFDPGPGGACAARPDHTPLIELRDPSGARRMSAAFASPLVQNAENCGMPEQRETFATIEGSWRVHVEGQGSLLATLVTQ